MPTLHRKQIFDFIMRQIQDISTKRGLYPYQAFPQWFAGLYFLGPKEMCITDGSGDGKVDCVFQTTDGKRVTHYVINSKFTEKYNEIAPAKFYAEAISYVRPFKNRAVREPYLSTVVSSRLRPLYRTVFKHYDAGRAKLLFVTNHRRNDRQSAALLDGEPEFHHLDGIIQRTYDFLEDAMPVTPPLKLRKISQVLAPDSRDTKVPTAIAYARLVDFIKYMERDPHDLLFARNIRLSLGNTPVNREIRETYEDEPTEFVFSNNGITVLCEKYTVESTVLTLRNPRVVNGSQTLHAIRTASKPSAHARVMVRIVEIPPPTTADMSKDAARKKEIIGKIALRSNYQNPIKKWDLVANDDFQHQMARYFRTQQKFYERRTREWKERKPQLKGLGISQGPNIRIMAQLMASHQYESKTLGPATAKGKLGLLFDEKPYSEIRKTRPVVAYQLHLLDSIISEVYRKVAAKVQYAQEMKGHIRFCLFASVDRALDEAGLSWGEKGTTELLADPHRQWSTWSKLVFALTSDINVFFKKAQTKHQRTEKKALTANNYFKSQKWMSRILKSPIPSRAKRLARDLLRG